MAHHGQVAGVDLVAALQKREEPAMPEPIQFNLQPDDVPTAWYNIVPAMAAAGMPPLPPLHPGTHQPVGPQDLAPLFPEALIMQEVSTDPWIDIPGEILDVYRLWRPTPLFRARRFEQALQTPAHIYFKYEGTSPAGSHKPNTAVAQAFYNKQAGVRRLTTETGAGQWGSALALACRLFDLECTVYMVKVSYDQKPYRKIMMQTWGAEGIPLPRRPVQGEEGSHRGGRTGSVSFADPRRIFVRFRRYGSHDAAAQDVHPGAQFRAAGHPCRRATLPRRRAPGVFAPSSQVH